MLGYSGPMCPQPAPQAAPALAVPPHSAPWPHSLPLDGERACWRCTCPPWCPKTGSLYVQAALWSSSFVSGSPSYCALSEVIWPSWTVLFPCCPWASQCWLPLCPHVQSTDQGAWLLLCIWVAKGCLVSSVRAAAGLPGPTSLLSSLVCVHPQTPA